MAIETTDRAPKGSKPIYNTLSDMLHEINFDRRMEVGCAVVGMWLSDARRGLEAMQTELAVCKEQLATTNSDSIKLAKLYAQIEQRCTIAERDAAEAKRALAAASGRASAGPALSGSSDKDLVARILSSGLPSPKMGTTRGPTRQAQTRVPGAKRQAKTPGTRLGRPTNAERDLKNAQQRNGSDNDYMTPEVMPEAPQVYAEAPTEG